jgi:glycopeptide antibiotics resistance protein
MDLQIEKSERGVRGGVTCAVLILYTLVLLWGIILKCNINEWLCINRNQGWTLWERFTFSIIPFESTVRVFKNENMSGMLAFFLNFLCLIPFGALLRFFTDRRTVIEATVILIMGIEVFQLFSGFGGFDFTDLILNTLGSLAGCGVYTLLRPRLSNKVLNVIMLCALPILSAAAIFAIVRTAMYPPI